jgi:hypothetical protein
MGQERAVLSPMMVRSTWLWLGTNRDLLLGLVAIFIAGVVLVTFRRWNRRGETGREVDQAADRLRRSLRATLLRNVALLSDLPKAIAIESNPRGLALEDLEATVVDRGKLLTQAQCDAVANAHTQLAGIDEMLRQRAGGRNGKMKVRREIVAGVPIAIEAGMKAVQALQGQPLGHHPAKSTSGSSPSAVSS